YPHLTFILSDAAEFSVESQFDYIIISDLLSSLWDIQTVLANLKKFVQNDSKIIISTYNYIWEPVLRFGEIIGIKARQPLQSWLTIKDISNLLALEDYEVIKVDRKLLIPKYIPVINYIFNKFFANL